MVLNYREVMQGKRCFRFWANKEEYEGVVVHAGCWLR